MNTLVLPKLITPVHAGFRDLELPEAFSWEAGIDQTAIHGLYVVAFRSLRNLQAPPEMIDQLLELDGDATEEAQHMPGFHTYWHDDDLSAEGYGLSFCLWDSREEAKHAAQQPKHRAAVMYARGEGREVYLSYDIETHNIFRFAGAKIVFALAA
ncbi:MAG: hypothetical protein ABIR37_02010 [Candidatus Saccharimonadales bacterium]